MSLSSKNWIPLGLGLGTAYAFTLHFLSLQQSSFANGWDSYFYLVQIKNYLEEGELVSSRLSLFYPFLIGIQSIAQDYVLTWKIAGALLSACFPLLCYGVLNAMGLRRPVAVLGFALAIFSPHLFYFSAQYLKNLMGMDLVLLLLMFLFRGKMRWALVVLLLSVFTHKAAAGIGIVAFVVHFLLHRNTKLLPWLLGAAALVLVVSFIAPVVFSINDLFRESTVFSNRLEFSYHLFLQDSGIPKNEGWRWELILTLISLPLFWLLYRKGKREMLLAVSVLHISWALFNLPIWSQHALGYGFRFFLQSALLAPLLLAVLFIGIKKQVPLYLLSALLLFLASYSVKAYEPSHHDPPYVKYHFLSGTLESMNSFADAELYIAHKGLAEYIKFDTGKDAMSWIPEYPIAADRLWRIVKTNEYAAIYSYFESDEEAEMWHRLSSFYFLVPEYEWQAVYQRISQKDSQLLEKLSTWQNPNKMRPEYMQKYRK